MSLPADRLILASTSSYRSNLMQRLGLPFSAVAPKYEEVRLHQPHEKIAAVHALGKAKSLAEEYPDSLIIGSDQLVSFEDNIMGKPGDEEAAVKQLMRLQGRSHLLITALVVYEPATARKEFALDIHEMNMRPLSESSIRAYVNRDQPIYCAGSYKLEELGIALFTTIGGSDDTAVVGLPLMKLVELLLRFDVDPLEQLES